MPASIRRRLRLICAFTVITVAAVMSPAAVAAPPETADAGRQPGAFPGRPGPQNPFLAPDGRGATHGDSQSSGTTPLAGPGAGPHETTMAYGAVCPTTAMDGEGYLIARCVQDGRPSLRLMHPKTLRVLASVPQPPTSRYAVHFYLDRKDRTVIAGGDGHIRRMAHRQGEDGRWRWETEQDWDVRHVLDSGCGEPRCDDIVSVKPDWTGRIWFSSTEGVVGTLNPRTGAVRSVELPAEETVIKAISTSPRGTALTSDHAVYLFGADDDGRPRIVWRESYERGGGVKPGKWYDGSGTSPSFFGPGDDRYLAVMDSASPREQVRVYRVGGPRDERLLCSIPVFDPGASATDNTFIASGRSIIATNTYGYDHFDYTPRPLAGGMTRIDVRQDESGCEKVWDNPTSTTTMAKLSLSKGIVYHFERGYSDGASTYSFMAIDAVTGRTLGRTPLGRHFIYEGLGLSGMAGPDGSYYQGVLGGMVRVGPAAVPGASGASDG